MPVIPIERGYKLLVLANSTEFMSEFQIDTENVKGFIWIKLGRRVVHDFTESIVLLREKFNVAIEYLIFPI